MTLTCCVPISLLCVQVKYAYRTQFIKLISHAMNIDLHTNTHTLMHTGQIHAYNIHCWLQTQGRPCPNLPSGEGQSCEVTTRREKFPLFLSRNFNSTLHSYKAFFSLFSSLSLSLSLSLTHTQHNPQLLAGASDRLIGDLQLVRDPSKYRYLSGSNRTATDEHMYSEVLKSMMVYIYYA